MYILVGAVILFLVLVTFHEYGHYSVARFFKIKILKFSIGFGPDIINWRNKEGVRFSLSAIPLGGYVAFHDPGDVENYNKLSSEEKKYVLANRPALEKALVTLAGPFYNFILAFVVFASIGMVLPRESDVATAQVTELSDSKLYQVISINDVAIKNAQELELRFFEQTGYTGNLKIRLFDYDMQSEVVYSKEVIDLTFPQDKSPSAYFSFQPILDFTPVISSVEQDSIAFQSGIREGDLITKINDKDVFSTLQANELLNQFNKRIYIEVQRDDQKQFITLPIKREGEMYGISLMPGGNNIFESISYGASQTLFWITNTFKFLARTFTGSLGLDNLSGPVGIAKVAGDSLSNGIIPFLMLMAILSISLGAFNLLPLPMLDGGQFLFILVEELKGSPISMKLKAALFNLSYLLIMVLFVFVIVNDIGRLL